MNAFEYGKQYIDSKGFMTLTLDKTPTDNPYLFTATWLYHLKDTGHSFERLRMRMKFDAAIRRSMTVYGLPNPQPSWDTPTISHDEILGCCLVSHFAPFAMWNYGKWRLFVYNNRKKIKDIPGQCMLRFPTKLAFMSDNRFGDVTYTPFHLFAITELLLSNRKTPLWETSGRCMRYLMADYWYKQNGFMGWAAKVYLKRLESQYGSVDKLYEIYFGADHPITMLTKGKKFL